MIHKHKDIIQKGVVGNDCKSAGGHYNPHNKKHGDLNVSERHEGDFGNIVADKSKTAKISIIANNLNVTDLIGK